MNKARLAQVLRNMEQQGLPQIVVSAPPSIFYLTGVWPYPGERLFALYINGDGTTRLFANELFGSAEKAGVPVTFHKDTDSPIADLARAVRPGIIGIDKFWSAKFLIGLMEARPDLTPRHGSGPVDGARMCKDDDEIAAMRAASLLNDQVMEYGISAIRAGMKEKELAGLMLEKYAALGAGAGEGLISSFGPGGADPHHGPDDTVLREGDSIVLDIFMPMPKYWCDMTRTVFYKTVSEEQRRVYETVRTANLAAEAVIRPGMEMREFDKVARDLITQAGYGPNFTHRLGHGIGLECHEPPDNSSADRTIARPGMVFSVEPGIYLPGKFGVRIEDLVLVTETGCEVLNHYTKDLQVIE